MLDCCTVGREVWEKELAEAGWTHAGCFIYRSPSGLLYRGPHKAWHVMKDGIEAWERIEEQREMR
jgi:hypothetical protein